MPETATYSIRTRYSAGESRLRTLIWISDPHFHGPGCSQCAWLFRPSGPPIGNSLMEMKKNYRRSCNEEFARHICAEHPRATKHKDYVSPAQKALHRDTHSRGVGLPAQKSTPHILLEANSNNGRGRDDHR